SGPQWYSASEVGGASLGGFRTQDAVEQLIDQHPLARSVGESQGDTGLHPFPALELLEDLRRGEFAEQRLIQAPGDDLVRRRPARVAPQPRIGAAEQRHLQNWC